MTCKHGSSCLHESWCARFRKSGLRKLEVEKRKERKDGKKIKKRKVRQKVKKEK